MLRDLLDANRIRAGERLPLRLDTCDLGQIADEVVEELRVVHGDRFVIGSADRVRGVWSRDELRRALWNLGSNGIFEPFTRTSDSAQSGIERWGLGLTLVRGVVEAHGGHVSMTSSESEGTTFTIEIPLDARPYQGGHGAETTPATIH